MDSSTSGEGRKGTLLLTVVEAKDLPKADFLGKSDPYVTVTFNTGPHATTLRTKTVKNTINPQWGELLKFPVYTEDGEAELRVYDHDVDSDDVLCDAPVLRVGGSRSEGDEWIPLECPAEKRDEKKWRLRSFGELHVRWQYTYSPFGDLFAAEDDEPMEEEGADVKALVAVLCRLGAYGYSAASFVFGAVDIMMWNRPFASMAQIAFVVFAALFTQTMMEAAVPCIVLLAMGRTWFMRLRYGSDWDRGPLPVVEMPHQAASTVPGARIRRTMPQMRQLLANPGDAINPLKSSQYIKLAYVWSSTLVAALDAAADVLSWRNEAAAQIVTRGALACTCFVYFFGVPWVLWRYVAMLLVIVLHTVFPCYYLFPRLRGRMLGAVQAAGDSVASMLQPIVSLVTSRLPPSLGGKAPDHLPPVPSDDKPYDYWKSFHDDRERQRSQYRIGTPRTGGLPGAGRVAAPAQAAADCSLRVEVLNARGLPADIMPLCPYVKVTLKQGQKFKTKPSTDCQWDIAFTFRGLTEAAVRSPFTVELLGPSSDPRLLAIGLVAPDQLGARADMWLPLRRPSGAGDGCGELRLCLRLESGPAAAAAPVPPAAVPAQQPQSPPTAVSPAGGGGGGGVAGIDALYEQGNFDATLRAIESALASDPGNAELLWRHGRACYDCGSELPRGSPQEEFFKKGLASALKSKAAGPHLAESWKWSAILTSKCADYQGTKERISKAYDIRDWALKALEINSSDSRTNHLLGAWYYNVASLSWVARNAAKALFGAPPEGTYQEALPYLLKAHELGPFHANTLMIGDAYKGVGDAANAKKYWQECIATPATTNKDREIQNEAKKR